MKSPSGPYELTVVLGALFEAKMQKRRAVQNLKQVPHAVRSYKELIKTART